MTRHAIPVTGQFLPFVATTNDLTLLRWTRRFGPPLVGCKILFVFWVGHCFGKDAQSCGRELANGRNGS